MIRKGVPILIALGAALAAASGGAAAPTAAVCGSLKVSRVKINYETLAGWTCSSAKTWIVKLAADHVAPSNHNVRLTNGPRGYHCFATPLRRGSWARSGTCFTGTITFPGKGFAWFEA